MGRFLGALLIAVALALPACGDDDVGDGDPATDATGQGSGPYGGDGQSGGNADKQAVKKDKPSKPGTEITVSGSQFGEIIFDSDNQAIYLFDAETTSKPECYGACAEAWPPVLTDGEPVAAGAADQKLLGTTKRD